MAEPSEKEEKPSVVDEGIDVGISRLTEEKIQSVINSVIDNETGARLKTYVETCIHCGLCSEACHYYLSHDKDPHFSPVGKVKQTIWEMLKKKGRVSPEFIRRAAIIAHTECNLCKRCAQYCPFGIDIAYLMSVVRRIIHRLGVTPLYIQDTAHSHSVTMNQMWVKGDEWPDTLQWQEEEAQAEIPDLRIPLEKEGADIMYSVIAPEPKFQAQLIYQAAVHHACGRGGLDHARLRGLGQQRHGHVHRGQRNHGAHQTRPFRNGRPAQGEKDRHGRMRPRLPLGLRHGQPLAGLVHAAVYHCACHRILPRSDQGGAHQNRQKIRAPDHPPRSMQRDAGGGLHEKARYVAHALCENVIEMHPNGEHNYCCCAGGGVINTGPPFKMTRIEWQPGQGRTAFRSQNQGCRGPRGPLPQLPQRPARHRAPL
jgi:ferredoxin